MLRAVLSNSPGPENKITTLTYRGVTYKVPENYTHSLGYASENLTASMREELIYRGVQYKQASNHLKIHISNVGKQLSYRGVTYEVKATY